MLLSLLTAAVVASATASDAAPVDTVRPLNDVIVTGTNRSLQRNLLPYTVSVVNNSKLEAQPSTQVLSAISGMIPSLFVTERSIFGFGVSNGGSGHIKMRGVGGDRASAVLMLVDGEPQFAGIYSHSIADIYGKEYVERVEILRGPGSVLYGSNAMGGAINVITRSGKSDGVKTTLKSEYGSYNTWLSSVTNTVKSGNFSSLVSASYNRTDGSIRGLRSNMVDVYARIGYSFSRRWKASADYSFMNFRGKDPVYPRLSDAESTDVYRQNIIRGQASVTLSNNYEALHGALRVYYNYGNHFIDDPRHFHSTDDRLGAILYQNFSPWHGADATLGFDFDRYSGRIPESGGQQHRPGSLQTIDRESTTEYSPYLTFAQTFLSGVINVSAGLRMANSNRFDTQWVPQGGFSINPGKGWNIKGNLAMGYRNPSFRELYLYRPANPDLEPEKMMNYEIAVAKSFGRYLSLDLTGYFSRGSNMIQTVDMKNRNTGRFYNKGIELSATSHPLDNLFLSASYSYLHTSLGNLTGAPRHQYYIGAQWRLTERLLIDADLKGVSRLYVGSAVPLQSYATLNTKVSFDVWRQLNLFVKLNNITAARYETVAGYRMPGFNALGGFVLTL